MFSASEQLLQETDLVVDVENGEIGFQPDHLGMAAQNLHADRVEGAEPRHAFDHAADDLADAVFHLARRLVGEGDGQNLAGPGAAGGENVGDAHGEHAGLAGAGAGQHQHRAVQRLDREPLFRIEAGEVRRRRRGGTRTRGYASRRRGRRVRRIDVALQTGQPRLVSLRPMLLILMPPRWHLKGVFTRLCDARHSARPRESGDPAGFPLSRE